jgi:hypothetical protein
MPQGAALPLIACGCRICVLGDNDNVILFGGWWVLWRRCAPATLLLCLIKEPRFIMM